MKKIITILRVAIGWHFLYEGLIKLFSDNWSAESYLNNTYGFLSGFYHWLTASTVSLAVVDFLNIWGLILIGLALFLGVFIRWSSLFGALLLTLYYFAYPPFGVSLLGGDGSTYIINQLFIEAAALVFISFYKDKGYGLYNLIPRLQKGKKVTSSVTGKSVGEAAGNRKGEAAGEALGEAPGETADDATSLMNRREVLKDLAALPVLGLMGWGAWHSGKTYGIDTLSGATIQLNRASLSELKGVLPKGKLGVHEMTRLVAGGNLIAGFAHARDLLYVDTLFKAYNTEKKIIETLMMCEQAGVNAISIGYQAVVPILKYKKMTGSKFKVISQSKLNLDSKDIFEDIKTAIDGGVDIVQVHGGQCDSLAFDNKTDLIGQMIDFVRSQGLVCGLGAHTVDSLIACEENGIIPDYYMHTMHHDDYWSAHPREYRKEYEILSRNSKDHNYFHDNLFCPFPERTVEFVGRAKVPVMGYKVLAAGAIRPEDGFKWAFENGADFICVGMFDFQVVKDVNICYDTLQNLKNRPRAWYS